MPIDVDLSEAQATMSRLLAASTERQAHVRGVAVAARDAAEALPGVSPVVILAAWLHDVGYADEALDTGFHSLDGARYLRSAGHPERLCRLVANHTHAWVEAEGRGLSEVLAEEFPAEHSVTADVLTYADLTTGPTGERVTVEQRIDEVLRRYPADDVVHQSIAKAAPDLIATVHRVQQLLADAQPR